MATAPETVAAFALFVLAWGAGFAGILPIEVWVIDFPALALAFFLDTLAFNEFGIRENSVFYPALAVAMYLEAMLVGAVIRWWRQNHVVGEAGDSSE